MIKAVPKKEAVFF